MINPRKQQTPKTKVAKVPTQRKTKRIEYRDVLVHVKCNDAPNSYGFNYDLMLYGKQHHWGDDQPIFIIAHCDANIFDGLKQAPGSEKITPEKGLILRISVKEPTIEWRHEKRMEQSFLIQGDVERVLLHESETNAHLICSIDQMPEAIPAVLVAEEYVDLPF